MRWWRSAPALGAARHAFAGLALRGRTLAAFELKTSPLLFPVSRVPEQPVAPAVRETLLTVANAMPPSPGILAQLGQVLLDPEADLLGISTMLKRDAALTARIIRISNSAVYNTGEPYASLEAALARVGMKEVYRMAGFAAVTQMSDQRLTRYGISGVQLRENALLGALVMEQLAERVGQDSRLAYTAGLLRSTGKIAVDRMARTTWDQQGDLTEWETSAAGISGCRAAAMVLGEWRFSGVMVRAILDHYLIDGSGDPLAYLLNLAAGAASRGGHGLPGEAAYWALTPEKLSAARLDEGDVDDALLQALATFAEIRTALD